MQFISILLALLGDCTRNGLIVCNLIPIIPGIFDCKSNKKSVLFTFHLTLKLSI